MNSEINFKQTNPHSMTGFGRANKSTKQIAIGLEAKSVNSRFLEVRPKIPRLFSSWEPLAREYIRKKIKRGSVDIHVSFQVLDLDCMNLLDEVAAKSLANSAKQLSKDLNINDGIDALKLISLPNVLKKDNTPNFSENETEEMHNVLSEALEQAMQGMLEMRANEGKSLIESLQRELLVVEDIRSKIFDVREKVAAGLLEKITTKIETILNKTDHEVDPARIAQEAAFYVNRSDITEELDRLKCHFEQFSIQLEAKENFVIGKRLDFLAQEMLREANTIGSKSDNSAVTNYVIDLKVSLERVREQVQNIE